MNLYLKVGPEKGLLVALPNIASVEIVDVRVKQRHPFVAIVVSLSKYVVNAVPCVDAKIILTADTPKESYRKQSDAA